MKRTIHSLVILCLIIFSLAGCSKSQDSNDSTTYIKLNMLSNGPEITKDGTYVISGELFDEKIDVEAQGEVRLILSGVTIQNDDDEAIKTEPGSHTIIEIAENTENTLISSGDATINAKGSIEICGTGKLYIDNKTKHGIESDGDIIIESGNIDISSYEHGIKSEMKINVLGGNINIQTQTGKGIKAEKEYIGEGGNVTIYSVQDEGLESKGALTINDGIYEITSCDDAINAGTSDSVSEKSNTKEIMPPPPEHIDNTPIEDGDIITIPEGATTSGRGIPFEHERQHGGFGKANADSVITINGGTIKINTSGDGIDSNGSLTIKGGTVIIDGPKKYDNGSLDSDGEMIIENATVICASSNGMTQYPMSMTQKSIIIDFDTGLKKDTVIVIKDSEQNILVEHTVGVICERFYFTSPEVKDDVNYTVYINGAEHSTAVAEIPKGGFGNMRKPAGKREDFIPKY